MSSGDIRTAVVTGGGSGLGRAVCLRLAEPGVKILVADLNQAGADATAGLIRKLGGEAEVFIGNVSDAAQVEAMAEHADRFLGRTDFLMNNAGVAVAGNVGEVPLDDWNW